ncbi:MAG: aminopeptidase [Thermoprotei archaeon]|nr:MAG: aminopeptidase [Thermoprotei archaeon]
MGKCECINTTCELPNTMKIYIITDLEGVAGIVIEEQTRPGAKYYDEARLLLTREVNAAVEGALDGGADEILVNDGHNGGFNIMLEELHEEAKLVHGVPRTFSLVGLDRGVDVVFLIGYHAMAGTPRAVLDHTMSSLAIHDVYLNGVKVGEIGLMAAIAGYYDVPVGLVTGCEKACEEARKLLGDVEFVVTKRGYGRNYAITLSPKKARKLIREASKRAVTRAKKGEFKPFRVESPVELKIVYNKTVFADSFEGKPMIERLDSRTILCRGDDLLKVLRAVGFC